MEKWTGVIYNDIDYSEWLEVSNYGRIRNPKTGTMRKLNILKTGYYFVSFSMGSRSKKKTIRVHKAVLESFKGRDANREFVNHIDGNKLNNHIDNLEWVTPQENAQHALDNGLLVIYSGEEHGSSILSNEDVFYIRENYKPYCRENGARALGRKFNIEHSSIVGICQRKTWKHI